MNKLKRLLINKVSVIVPEKRRGKFLKFMGLNIGDGTLIRKGYFFDEQRVTIGRNCFINRNCQFHLGGGANSYILIGDNVRIAMDVDLICVSHKIGNKERRAAEDTYLPIEIGDGCWIGARAVILQGVHVGEGTVIAAGAVVTKDCEPNSLYAGVPARKIKELKI
jgi:maltose O-acetyltransferase